MVRRFLLIIPLLTVAALSGCATLDDDSLRTPGASFVPSAAVLKRAAWRAASDPRSWAPALGAAVFAATSGDRRLSDWAVEQQPLFGSREAAINAGDDLRDLATAGAVVTALAVLANPPSPPFFKGGMEDNADYQQNPDASPTALIIPDTPSPTLKIPDTSQPPLKKGGWGGFLVQTGAHFAAAGTTWTLKHSVNRRRPDGSDEKSFPSGHTTSAFADATLAQRNLDTLRLSPWARQGLGTGFDTLAVGTGWARLESGEHYPSDVLAGAAIGHFMAAFVTGAFLDDGREVRLGFLPSRHGSRLELSLAF